MATGAHGVPVLSIARPVKPIVWRYHLSGVLMKPFFIPLIPALACGLQPASGKFDQILLQGKNPKGVQHRVVVILTIVSLRMDKELAVSFKKPARDTIGREGNPAEVT